MLLYFSATGNCKYVATRLIQFEKQEMLSMVDCIRNDQYTFSDKTIGIISPTYDLGLPSIVKEFLEKASFQTEYLYYIASYGTTPGASGTIAKNAIRTVVCRLAPQLSLLNGLPNQFITLRYGAL